MSQQPGSTAKKITFKIIGPGGNVIATRTNEDHGAETTLVQAACDFSNSKEFQDLTKGKSGAITLRFEFQKECISHG